MNIISYEKPRMQNITRIAVDNQTSYEVAYPLTDDDSGFVTLREIGTDEDDEEEGVYGRVLNVILLEVSSIDMVVAALLEAKLKCPLTE